MMFKSLGSDLALARGLGRQAFALSLAATAGVAAAAPLDALLEANPAARYGRVMVEVSADAMNDTLDVFNVRESSGLNVSEGTGDYSGATLRAGFEPAPGFWLEGALQQRTLTYGPDRPRVDSWRLAGQWRALEQQGMQPAAALRLSSWGDSAGELVKSTPTTRCVGSFCLPLERLSVKDPEDLQWQADVVTSWESGQWTLSTFAGLGRGEVKVPSVSTQLFGQTVTYANGAFTPDISGLVDLSNLKAELQTLNYRTHTAQLGFNLAWTQGPWLLRGGYALQQVHRDGVDDAIKVNKGNPVTLNHTLLGEAAYKVTEQVYLFARGQWMKSQFLSEVPFLYNSVTARRFEQQYGLVSFGVGATF